MAKLAILPPEIRATADHLKMSPAIVSGNLVFLTGTTGGDDHGHMPDDPETQFRSAFAEIDFVLHAGNLTFDAIVDLTTYHVGLRDPFDPFDRIRREHMIEPYPAWTAVEVAGPRSEGAIVEIRANATADPVN